MSAPRDEDRLLDHKYDDIQEYDNPLPGWWTLILWGTIVWAVLYFFNFIPGLGTGKGRIANYQADSTAAAEKYGVTSPTQTAASAAIDKKMNDYCTKNPTADADKAMEEATK